MGVLRAVECLRCGSNRETAPLRGERLEPGECPRCGYLGWALAADLSDPVRTDLLLRPPERRGARGRLFAL